VRFDRAWFETLAPVLAADPLYTRSSGHLTAQLLFETDGRAALVRLARIIHRVM
jgi:hypothetical protein